MRQVHLSDKYYIAVFDSKNHAVQVYQYLKQKKYQQFQLISTPCRIRAGCSYSIRFLTLEDYDILLKEVGDINKKIASIYEAEKVDKKRVLKELKFT
ncbi:MAG: DUF3343 domain-containing protein [Clostridiaceae bacterium]|nr:DUF3343 domain-containing protein [Clostridiaceae bacterium]